MYSNNNSVYLYRDLLRPAEAKESVPNSVSTPIRHNHPQFKEFSPEANYAISSYGQAMLNLNLPPNI